ncbi:MAG: hypothetical protein U9O56_04245 [Campylobacterota bacterium]|nr:hypothetical protein [Campylobacterota bacterium]
MASDLSHLVEETLCNTLNGLLAKEAILNETNKVNSKDLLDIELLKVDSTYEFDNITSTWSYYIPAYTASLIFNLMLGDESEPALSIDADIADAINEFVSNTSGGLTTAINGSGFEDLGNSKFSIIEKEIIPANSIDDFTNMYKFSINLDGKPINIFILFDKVVIPFLDKISQSIETVYEEEIINDAPEESVEESIEESNEEKNVEESPEEPNQSTESTENIDQISNEEENNTTDKTEELNNSSDTNNSDEKNDDEDKEELSQEELKNKKLKKIIIIVGGLLALTIVSGLIMFFLGMFDPEPYVPPADANQTKTIKTEDNLEIVKYPNKSGINFKSSMINKVRLNARLEILTKYELLNAEEIERLKLAEKQRLLKLKKEEELLAFANQNKEEDIFNTDIKNNNSTNNLKFVLVHSLKYTLYKKLVLKTKSKNSRISICKNENGRTAVYIGPFESQTSQSKMLNLLKEQNHTNVSLENLTQTQFDARCNFE